MQGRLRAIDSIQGVQYPGILGNRPEQAIMMASVVHGRQPVTGT